MKKADELLEEIAKKPSLDDFFNRVPSLSAEEVRAMRELLRAERASWGPGRGKGE
jgi:hypothetical protein